MSEFTQGEWVYREYIPEGITLNGVEYLIHIEGEDDPEKDIALALKEADARLIAEAKNMYKLLHKVLKRMNNTNKAFREGYYVDDMYEGITLIDDDLCRNEIETLLKRIDSEQEA